MNNTDKQKGLIELRQNGIPSKGEELIIKVLNKHNVKYEREKYFEDLVNPSTGMYLFYDFYLPEINALIEFDGIYHFKNHDKKKLKSQKERDNIKNEYCIKNRIYLLRIKCYSKEDVEKIIINFFISIDSGNKNVVIESVYTSNKITRFKGFSTIKELSDYTVIETHLIGKLSMGDKVGKVLCFLICKYMLQESHEHGEVIFNKKEVQKYTEVKPQACTIILNQFKNYGYGVVGAYKGLAEFPVLLNIAKINKRIKAN